MFTPFKTVVVAATWIIATLAVPTYAATAANSQNGTTSSNAANETPPGTTLGSPDPAAASIKVPAFNGAGVVNGTVSNLPSVPALPGSDAPK